MSKRIPYAMRTLIQQIGEQHDVTTDLSDLDGFGVYRTVTFGDADHLTDLFAALDADRRIEKVDGTTITFTTNVRADHTERFDLAGVEAVLNEDEAPQQEPEVDPEYEARKSELTDTPVDDLREAYGFDKSDKKADIVKAILELEFA